MRSTSRATGRSAAVSQSRSAAGSQRGHSVDYTRYRNPARTDTRVVVRNTLPRTTTFKAKNMEGDALNCPQEDLAFYLGEDIGIPECILVAVLEALGSDE